MYGFPTDLDLASALGHETTQLCVGPFDLQFTFGPVAFAVQSKVELRHNGDLVAAWEAGKLPEPGLYRIFNAPVVNVAVLDSKRLSLRLSGDLELQLIDNSDKHESMQICVGGPDSVYIV